MLIIVGEQIIGFNRIFGGYFGTRRFEANKRRNGYEGAKRAIETAGGMFGLSAVWKTAFLVLAAGGLRFMASAIFVAALIRSVGAAILLGYRAHRREVHGTGEQDAEREQ
jgi:hypothetical protein